MPEPGNRMPPSAIILTFPRRRGRPKSAPRGHDGGTPELAQKRRMGATTETLDLCLQRGIISEGQHWCGIHLRWLYTLRHGAPGVRAVDPTHLGGLELKSDDPQWRAAREQEYREAIRGLMLRGHVPLIMNTCIYNERPAFLSMRAGARGSRLEAATESLMQLREGLDILVALWGRQGK
jgi:hypothetical protein